MRVLLVDDDPDIRALAARAVGREFPEAELLQAGEPTSLPGLLAQPVDVLVSDYMLRWSDGFAILDLVKQSSPDCCSVMFTGTGNEELAVRAMKAGFDDYVVKSQSQLRRLASSVRIAYDRRLERRRLEEQRELLLRELYHRVHNNLQIVISLVRLTAKGLNDASDRQKLADLQQRIQAVSMLQEEFYRVDRIDAVPFHEFLLRIAQQQLGFAPNLVLKTELQPVMVSVPHAVPLALIANELLTNALKHAFPHGRAGTVAVELSREQDHVVLRVSDNGVGALSGEDAGAKLGLELIKGLARQIDANVHSEAMAAGGVVHAGVLPIMRALRVLVVEDEFLIAAFLEDLIEEAGHHVAAVAESADEALLALDDNSIDLAILDIRLKGERDGIELAGELQNRVPGLPFMFISGSGEAATRARAEAADPVAFLQKPFDQQKLKDILSELAGRH